MPVYSISLASHCGGPDKFQNVMADSPRHPFLQGLSKHRGAPPTVVVIFGASGDLTARKLIPAVYNLGHDNLLPADFFLVGYGRKAIPDEEFRALATDAIKEFSRRELNADVWARVAANTSYVAGGYDEKAAFDRLAAHIAAIEKKIGREVQTLFYISTPPSVFASILLNLGASGLARKYLGQPHHTKVIIEKPFGKDLESARELNVTIRSVLAEHQVYRIDHYLGKETVQDLLVQRFSNAIFEPLWNRNFIDSVQITVAEEVGVGTRGGYYEQSGCLRDMIQNHTMQLLALTAMEPPVSMDAEAVRDEKVKVLKAIQPLNLGPDGDVARAQYAAGLMGGKLSAVISKKKVSRLNRPRKPTPASASRSIIGAGRASRFTCAPANAWLAASPRSRSISSARPVRCFPKTAASTSRPIRSHFRFSPTRASA